MSRVVIFAFAGRRRNLEMQKHYVLELLSRYPNVEYHLWDVARRPEDRAYLQDVASESPQIRVFDPSGGDPWSVAYTHYARDENHRTDLFVKLNDDIVFIETARFDAFVAAVENSLLGIVSATVVNNGVCARTEPPLRDAVLRAGWVQDPDDAGQWWLLGSSGAFLDLAHRYFLEGSDALLNREPASYAIPRGRFSLDTIGCNWYVMRWIAERLRGAAGTNAEHVIATSFDVRIMQGFVTCRLHSTDQHATLSDSREQELLNAYAALRERYSGAAVAGAAS